MKDFDFQQRQRQPGFLDNSKVLEAMKTSDRNKPEQECIVQVAMYEELGTRGRARVRGIDNRHHCKFLTE